MGEVIDIATARDERSEHSALADRRKQILEELGVILMTAEEQFEAAALNIACTGSWAEWDAKQTEGEEVEVSLEDVRNCGDPLVAQLVDLGIEVRSVLQRLVDELEGKES